MQCANLLVGDRPRCAELSDRYQPSRTRLQARATQFLRWLTPVPVVALGLMTVALWALALRPPAAFAATLDVCGSCTYTTVGAALAAALANGEADTIRIAQGTYNETGLEVQQADTLSRRPLGISHRYAAGVRFSRSWRLAILASTPIPTGS